MNKKKRQNKAESMSPYYLVPSLLIVVAIIQIYLAHTGTLSPWRGGGFGMFAVVDLPGMRFLNVQALDIEGNPILIEADSFLTVQKKRFLQSMPTRRQLVYLADELMEQSYIPTGSPTLSAIQQFREQNPDLPVPASIRQQEAWPIFRVKKATDPDLPGERPRGLKAIRAGVWRIRFDARSHRVYSESMLEPVERGRWQ